MHVIRVIESHGNQENIQKSQRGFIEELFEGRKMPFSQKNG